MSYESYPPNFRPKNGQRPAGVDLEEWNDEDVEDPLPVIDLQSIDQEKLKEACRDWGMFRLINHGIPVRLLEELHENAKKLFSLSFESKQAAFPSPISYFWGTPGLTPSGIPIQREKGGISSSSNPTQISFNWLEGFHVLLTPLSSSQFKYEDLMLQSFRNLVEEYGGHQSRVGTTIFQALAKSLELDPIQRKSYLSPATGHLRVHRYPCCFESDQEWGIDVHTDSSLLSILHQDQVGGLQVLHAKHHQWFHVKPLFNSLIVNLGDTMQAVSDDIFIAAKHRVKVHKNRERISIGYFVFPYEDAVINSTKYKPFTYADFRAEVQHDLKTIGYKIGLPKFRLHDRTPF